MPSKHRTKRTAERLCTEDGAVTAAGNATHNTHVVGAGEWTEPVPHVGAATAVTYPGIVRIELGLLVWRQLVVLVTDIDPAVFHCRLLCTSTQCISSSRRVSRQAVHLP